MIRRTETVRRCAVVLAALSIGSRAHAQETQVDLHGSLAIGTSTHSRSWGAGFGPQFTFGGSSAPLRASVSPGFDYLMEGGGRPSQKSLSLDVNIQPGGASTVTPYVGGGGAWARTGAAAPARSGRAASSDAR